MIGIRECGDKLFWNKWFEGQKYTEFLQSWEWGEFQASVGNNPIRLQVLEGDKVIEQLQGFEHKIFGGIKYVYFPRVTRYALHVTRYINKNYIFARIEPLGEIERQEDFKIIKTNNRQPQNTFILNVKKEEEEILRGMHSKTRYNINLSERKGVKIKQEKNIDIFWKLNEETITRDKFKSHNKDYYKKMLEIENCFQLTAYFDGDPIASIILIYFGDTVTYLHGSSGNKNRNLMAPYLLQWKGILLAKSLEASNYDFGGISPARGQRPEARGQETCFHGFCWEAAHKWTGITRFKVSFGGEPKNYPDAVEVVFKPVLYKLFQLIKKFL